MTDQRATRRLLRTSFSKAYREALHSPEGDYRDARRVIPLIPVDMARSPYRPGLVLHVAHARAPTCTYVTTGHQDNDCAPPSKDRKLPRHVWGLFFYYRQPQTCPNRQMPAPVTPLSDSFTLPAGTHRPLKLQSSHGPRVGCKITDQPSQELRQPIFLDRSLMTLWEFRRVLCASFGLARAASKHNFERSK